MKNTGYENFSKPYRCSFFFSLEEYLKMLIEKGNLKKYKLSHKLHVVYINEASEKRNQ